MAAATCEAAVSATLPSARACWHAPDAADALPFPSWSARAASPRAEGRTLLLVPSLAAALQHHGRDPPPPVWQCSNHIPTRAAALYCYCKSLAPSAQLYIAHCHSFTRAWTIMTIAHCRTRIASEKCSKTCHQPSLGGGGGRGALRRAVS